MLSIIYSHNNSLSSIIQAIDSLNFITNLRARFAPQSDDTLYPSMTLVNYHKAFVWMTALSKRIYILKWNFSELQLFANRLTAMSDWLRCINILCSHCLTFFLPFSMYSYRTFWCTSTSYEFASVFLRSFVKRHEVFLYSCPMMHTNCVPLTKKSAEILLLFKLCIMHLLCWLAN